MDTEFFFSSKEDLHSKNTNARKMQMSKDRSTRASSESRGGMVGRKFLGNHGKNKYGRKYQVSACSFCNASLHISRANSAYAKFVVNDASKKLQ
jgi:hypothetical protein